MESDSLTNIQKIIEFWVVPILTSVIATLATTKYTDGLKSLRPVPKIAAVTVIFIAGWALMTFAFQKHVAASATTQQRPAIPNRTSDFPAPGNKSAPQTTPVAVLSGGARTKIASDAKLRPGPEQADSKTPVSIAPAPEPPELPAALENAEARMAAATGYWDDIRVQLERNQRTLRPEISAELMAARVNGARCQQNADAGQWPQAQTCIDQLSQHLDKLDSYK